MRTDLIPVIVYPDDANSAILEAQALDLFETEEEKALCRDALRKYDYAYAFIDGIGSFTLEGFVLLEKLSSLELRITCWKMKKTAEGIRRSIADYTYLDKTSLSGTPITRSIVDDLISIARGVAKTSLVSIWCPKAEGKLGVRFLEYGFHGLTVHSDEENENMLLIYEL